LTREDKVKHYIKIKTHNIIVLRFWYKIGIKYLISVRLKSFNHIKSQFLDDYEYNSYIYI